MFGYEPKGQGFESLAARQKEVQIFVCASFLFIRRNQKGDSNPQNLLQGEALSKEIYNRRVCEANKGVSEASRVPCSAPCRHGLCIVRDGFFIGKSHPSLTPSFLLSETGHAQVACSVVNALTTALFRYHPVSVEAV